MPRLRPSTIPRLRPSFPARFYSISNGPRHLLSIADLSPSELTLLILNAAHHKTAARSLQPVSASSVLRGQAVGMIFQKRSTRTRVSTESAVVALGGHPVYLGADDIQLGKSESLRDTSVVLSGMLSCITARVGPHSDIEELARWSSVPVLNALSDRHHPLQIVADFLTMAEHCCPGAHFTGLMGGLKIAWVGDANNVLTDLAIGAVKLGVHLAVAAPTGYSLSAATRAIIQHAADTSPHPGTLKETVHPEEAIKDAAFIITDTWTSMGQDNERADRLRAFTGFQVTNELAERGGADPDWKFLHCLPRYPEEVDDAVFYGPRSRVFQESANRRWAAISVLRAFVVNRGEIVPEFSREEDGTISKQVEEACKGIRPSAC